MLIRVNRSTTMSPPLDWLSSLPVMMPVRGRLEIPCSYGAPWRATYGQANPGEMPYHMALAGSAILESPDGGAPQCLTAGDIALLPHGAEHMLHDGSGAPPSPVRSRIGLNVEISENAGSGDRLDMLCGRSVLSPPHDCLMRSYLPATLAVRASKSHDQPGETETSAQLATLVCLMRTESSKESRGSHAMLNALSAALFALTLRMAG